MKGVVSVSQILTHLQSEKKGFYMGMAPWDPWRLLVPRIYMVIIKIFQLVKKSEQNLYLIWDSSFQINNLFQAGFTCNDHVTLTRSFSLGPP